MVCLKFLSLLCMCGLSISMLGKENENTENYRNNRPPLFQKEYMELPLGSIKARGWLQEMLERQRKGATSQMDVLYPEVMGKRNGWLGGDGDQWER